MISLYILAICASTAAVDATTWAVIAVGSNGYANYRHQADGCHAYQVMKSQGISEDHIIMLAYDDVAHDPANPFPGKLFNKPDKYGPGRDVYAGCNIDYKGNQVTSLTFLDVLTGNGTGKVLKSTAEDNVFVFFADHGAAGLITFPNDELHKTQLQEAFNTMQKHGMFKQMIVYFESCYSGSMFVGLSTPGVYAVSAAGPDEDSLSAYCFWNDLDFVNGIQLKTCLGDLFSVSWLEDMEAKHSTQESIEEQFQAVKERVICAPPGALGQKETPSQWGDRSFTNVSMSEFLCGREGTAFNVARARAMEPTVCQAVSSIQVSTLAMQRHFWLYSKAAGAQKRYEAGVKLQEELSRQQAAERIHMKLLMIAFPGDDSKQASVWQAKEEPKWAECELAGHESLRIHCASQFHANSGFALHLHQVVVNLCSEIAMGLSLDIRAAARQACSSEAFEEMVV